MVVGGFCFLASLPGAFAFPLLANFWWLLQNLDLIFHFKDFLMMQVEYLGPFTHLFPTIVISTNKAVNISNTLLAPIAPPPPPPSSNASPVRWVGLRGREGLTQSHPVGFHA